MIATTSEQSNKGLSVCHSSLRIQTTVIFLVVRILSSLKVSHRGPMMSESDIRHNKDVATNVVLGMRGYWSHDQ
jgi:hypothetical protein